MALIEHTPPATEPFVVDDLRDMLRLEPEETDQDDFVASLIAAARAQAEAYLRRRLITQTVTLVLDGAAFCGAGAIMLPVAPIQSVSEVRYTDAEGSAQVLAPAGYKLALSALPNELRPAYGKTWPDARAEADAVEIDIVAGYGEASAIPADIQQGMRLDIAHMFANREAVVAGTVSELPLGARAKLHPHRAWY